MSVSMTDHTGRRFRSKSEMARAWGVNPSAFKSRIDRGWSIEEALESPGRRAGACVDPLGRSFPSKRAMCEAWGVKVPTYRARRSNGLPLELALLSERVTVDGSRCTDPRGVRHASIGAMCDAWGVSKGTYRSRLDRGWSCEQALSGFGPNSVVDHRGTRYPNLAAMCRAYGIDTREYLRRRKQGCGLAEALCEQLSPELAVSAAPDAEDA